MSIVDIAKDWGGWGLNKIPDTLNSVAGMAGWSMRSAPGLFLTPKEMEEVRVSSCSVIACCR